MSNDNERIAADYDQRVLAGFRNLNRRRKDLGLSLVAVNSDWTYEEAVGHLSWWVGQTDAVQTASSHGITTGIVFNSGGTSYYVSGNFEAVKAAVKLISDASACPDEDNDLGVEFVGEGE